MKFGIQHPSFSYDGQPSRIIESLGDLAKEAERQNFDSFWVMDHFHQIGNVGEENEPMLEGWTTISTVAGLTSKIKLGTLVTGNAYRHPSVLAKIGATLDVLSKGRLFMGIGGAWNVREANAYGIPFPSTQERLERLEEAVQIVRKMWTEEQASFDGKYYRIQNAYCNPKPIQKPHPPIMVGGSGEKYTLKIVAQYADACNIFGSTQTVERKLRILREHCKTVGRDYDSIVKSKLGYIAMDRDQEKLKKRLDQRFKDVPQNMRSEFVTHGSPEQVKSQVEAFRDVGIDYFIVDFEPDRELEALKFFATEVASKF